MGHHSNMTVASMATTTMTQRRPQETPYQLDPDQTLKASQALLQHVQAETKRLQEVSSKRDLLQADTSDAEDDSVTDGEAPIWLTLTTKQQIEAQQDLCPTLTQQISRSSNMPHHHRPSKSDQERCCRACIPWAPPILHHENNWVHKTEEQI